MVIILRSDELENKRNATIDVLRGIATLSVLLGHAIQRGMITGYDENIIFKIIYTFHMPLFMLLSGYTLSMSKKPFDQKFIISKLKSLIYPTVIWSYLIYFVRDFSFVGIEPFIKFPDSVGEYTKAFLVNPDFVIWFLYIVFLCDMVVFVGKKFFDKYINVYFLIAIALVEVLPVSVFGVLLLKVHLPFFIGGYLIQKHKQVFFEYLRYALLPAIVAYVYMMVSNWPYLSSRPFQWAFAMVALPIVYYIAKNVRIKPIEKSLTFFGRYSMEIYLCQCLVLNIGIGTGYMRIVSIFISATALATLLAYYSKNNKYAAALLYGAYPSKSEEVVLKEAA